MQGVRRRNRAVVSLAEAAVATALAAVFARLIVDEARIESIPGLAVAVFGTFLTSMAIIAAFSIQQGSRWPTPWEALDRAGVPAWFLVALGSVVAALLAGALASSFLSAFSLALALVAVPLGARGLWGLISLSTDQGRWALVVDLLADSILASGKVARPTEREPDLGEIDTEDHVPASFVTGRTPRRPRRTGVAIERVPGILREYADRRDLGAIVGLIDEVHAGACQALGGAGALAPGEYVESVDTLLHVQRQAFGELAERVLSGQLGDATARIALRRAGEAIVDTAGRARGAGAAAGGGRVEAVVARHLAALSRLAGAVATRADVRLRQDPRSAAATQAGGAERAGALALRTTCADLQQAIRWAVDPDPPGMKIPPDHVWQSGLGDAAGALTWLWSTTESATGPYGVGLYAVCQILTGRKFFDSYWDGYDVFTEIERGLYGGAGEGSAAAAGLAAVERAGGLARLALELGAMRLATTPPRSSGEPSFDGDPARRDDRHIACDLFLAGGGFKPAGRDPVADLAWLLTDRPRGSLWSLVHEQLGRLPDRALSPPLRPLHRHPEACALAVCLRLAPLDEHPGARLAAIEEFVAGLPGPLLWRTAALAQKLTVRREVRPDADRVAWEGALVEAARFARRVVPGPLPAQESGAPEPEPPSPAPPAALGGTDFEGAATRIAAADGEVDLVQCDRRWLDEWGDARAELDAELLAAALRRRARVRRIVLFDLPRDADRRATRLHYRWAESLAAAVGCVREGEGAGAPRYEVRRLIVTGAAGEAAIPADRFELRARRAAPGPGRERFDALWGRLDREGRSTGGLGLIEL